MFSSVTYDSLDASVFAAAPPFERVREPVDAPDPRRTVPDAPLAADLVEARRGLGEPAFAADPALADARSDVGFGAGLGLGAGNPSHAGT
jgi:hypothetical protein